MKSIDISKIDEMIEKSRDALAKSTIEMINIRSVLGEPLPGAPFGEGPKKMLDFLLDKGECDGFFTENYGVGVGSISYKSGKADLGIWTHADVVHEGVDWHFEPYAAVEYKGCVIGRGASDNKGQIAAVYRLFEIFRELGIELSYNPAIYIGTNEEMGMKDVFGIPENPDAKGFINVAEPPALSLVPDADFPVACGGKGAININLRSRRPFENLDFVAGKKELPFHAKATLRGAEIVGNTEGATVIRDENSVGLFATSRAIHGAHPDPNGNMITKLAQALINGTNVSDADKKILDFLRRISLDVRGEMFGIDSVDPNNSATVLFTQSVLCEDGVPVVCIRIRFPRSISAEKIEEQMRRVADAQEFDLTLCDVRYEPYFLNAESEIISNLCKIANTVTGDAKAPYVMGGGTYANGIPNAIPFGMSGNLPPEDFEEGRGNVHGVDEAVSLDRLVRAMKIYARALLWLDGKDFSELQKDMKA